MRFALLAARFASRRARLAARRSSDFIGTPHGLQSASNSRLGTGNETQANAETCAMQAANCGTRGVHVYGLATDSCIFLPLLHGLRTHPQWLALTRNHGRGRIHVFVAALLLALPLLLTLHTLDADPPSHRAQPPIDALNKMQRVAILLLPNQFHALSCALDKSNRPFCVLGDTCAPADLHNAQINQALEILQKLFAVGNGKRHIMPPLHNVVFGVRIERVCRDKVMNDASRRFGHRNRENEAV